MALCYSYVALDNEREEMLDKLNSKRRANQMVNSAVVHSAKRNPSSALIVTVSLKQYLTARNNARIHEEAIEPQNCELCQFKTIYPPNLKRHYQRSHNKVT